MEYIRTTTSSKYPPEEPFRIFFKNSQDNTREKVVANSSPETLVKHDLTKDVFLQLIFQKKFFLKNFVRLHLDGGYYSIKKHFQNTSNNLLLKACNISGLDSENELVHKSP